MDFLASLPHHAVIRYHVYLTPITIRNFTREKPGLMAGRRTVLLEHRSRFTCQLVVRGKDWYSSGMCIFAL